MPIRREYHHLPYFNRPERTRFQRVPDLAQESFDPNPGLDHGCGGLVDPCRLGALVSRHARHSDPGLSPHHHRRRPLPDDLRQALEVINGTR
jgi:hypothetical protein